MQLRVRVSSAEMVNSILTKIGAIVQIRAMDLAPHDQGEMAKSIRYWVEGNVVYIGTKNIPYADKMEYGSPPEPVSGSEFEDLKKWGSRKGVSPYAAKAKLEKYGLEGSKFKGKAGGNYTAQHPFETKDGHFRPFLRPALYQSMSDIRKSKNVISMKLVGK